MPQSNYCINTINRVGVGKVRVGELAKATARVPALTMTTIKASPVASHCKGGSGVEWGGDPWVALGGRTLAPPRATARVPAPLLSTPALTMTTIEASPVASHCKGGSGEEQGGDPCGRPEGGATQHPPRGVAYAAKRHHGVRALAYALLFALTLFLFPLPTSAHAASVTGTGRIYGQLLDGTKSNAPVAGQNVTLQMAQGDSARDLTKATTDAHGMFSFSGLDTDKTISYAVYTLYQGAQYYTDLIDLSTTYVQQIKLTVYDATTSIASIAIVQANILIDKVDAQNGLITVAENFFFENLGLTTYVGSLQAKGGMPNALRFSLPNKARKLSLSSGFNGYHVIQVDSGFATDAALPPGTSQFAFSFQVPYVTTSYNFAYTVVYPTVDLSLLVPLNIHASSSGLDSQGPVNANQHTYQQFKSQKLLAGDQFHVQLDGLPATQTSASPSPFNQNLLWIIVALLLMLAIVSVTWFVYRRSHRQAPTRQKQVSRRGDHEDRPSSKDQQEALLQELLDLDTAYEAGKIKKAEYLERRARTKANLRSLISTDLVEKTSTSKKTARSGGNRSTIK